MKRSILWTLVVCSCLVSVGRAQVITGNGTPGAIPVFTGPTSIGNSVVFQSGSDVGVAGNINVTGTGNFSASNATHVISLNQDGPGSGLVASTTGSGNGIAAVFAINSSSTGTPDSFAQGVFGWARSLTGSSIGVSGLVDSSTDFATGVNGLARATTGRTIGVRGQSDSENGFGVFGSASATSGGTAGVRGEVHSSTDFARGVDGVATATTGKTVGVLGRADSSSGIGVYGTANSATGGTIGLLGEVSSSSGTAGQFNNKGSGDIIIGQASFTNVFRVNGTGTVFADGGFQPFGADFAESMAVKGNRAHYAPGDLLVIDPSGERRLALSQTPYSTLVAGIYSTKPGVVASQHRMDDPALGNEVPLAVVGIVPCKVTAENGPIAVGDLLVTSSTPGRAMKGSDRALMLGAVVGKALEPLPQGAGVVQVLVTLQ